MAPSSPTDGASTDAAALDVAWTRSAPASRLREAVVCGVLGPLMDLYTSRTVAGLENLQTLDGPAIFVANHNSHMDTPALLRAMPGRWRRRTAVAAAADYFYADRHSAIAVSLLFGTVPINRRGGGLARATHLDRLIQRRRSLLVFAEGTRSHDGTVAQLRSGAAVLALEHGLPIVPIYVAGTGEAMPRGRRWMELKHGAPGSRRHAIDIRFGAPIRARPHEHCSALMERVRLFLAEAGAETEPSRRVVAPAREPVSRKTV